MQIKLIGSNWFDACVADKDKKVSRMLFHLVEQDLLREEMAAFTYPLTRRNTAIHHAALTEHFCQENKWQMNLPVIFRHIDKFKWWEIFPLCIIYIRCYCKSLGCQM